MGKYFTRPYENVFQDPVAQSAYEKGWKDAETAYLATFGAEKLLELGFNKVYNYSESQTGSSVVNPLPGVRFQLELSRDGFVDERRKNTPNQFGSVVEDYITVVLGSTECFDPMTTRATTNPSLNGEDEGVDVYVILAREDSIEESVLNFEKIFRTFVDYPDAVNMAADIGRLLKQDAPFKQIYSDVVDYCRMHEFSFYN